MLYTTYKCSVCRREKDIDWDSSRATPNLCTITKGCTGRLVPVGETKRPTPVENIAGIEDWYPRNRSIQRSSETSGQLDDVDLVSSAGGALVLAVEALDESLLPPTITLTCLQKRAEETAYLQFTFRTTASTTVITGKDQNGKNMRFDSTAISEKRIFVRVSGVSRTDFTLTPNTITFNSPLIAGSLIDITVYQAPIDISRALVLTKNTSGAMIESRGSWMNVKSVTRTENGIKSTWYLYSIDSLTGLSSGKIKIKELSIANRAIILFASIPYAAVDRYLSFLVELPDVSSDYVLSLSSDAATIIRGPRSVVKEVYPPLNVTLPHSFIKADPQTTNASSKVVTDESNSRLMTSKILGPV